MAKKVTGKSVHDIKLKIYTVRMALPDVLNTWRDGTTLEDVDIADNIFASWVSQTVYIFKMSYVIS